MTLVAYTHWQLRDWSLITGGCTIWVGRGGGGVTPTKLRGGGSYDHAEEGTTRLEGVSMCDI